MLTEAAGQQRALSCSRLRVPPRSDQIARILSVQNSDGGWGYRRGSSRVEPTVYALLALRTTGSASMPQDAGLEWLRRTQRADGGWAPAPGVAQSTWVTALPLLLGSQGVRFAHARAVQWLIAQSGRETSFTHRLRLWLLGHKSADYGAESGWPWFPGTAGWVVPTSLTLIALRSLRGVETATSARIAEARQFLLNHRCHDGGWNHGSSRALGYESNSYPETTGLALLALAGQQIPGLDRTIALAERQLASCSSAEGWSWLVMGLTAHGKAIREPYPALKLRTVLDDALVVLADEAARGTNLLIQEANG